MPPSRLLSNRSRSFSLAIAAMAAAIAIPSISFGQGKAVDYARAEAFRDLARDKVARASVRPHWSDGGDTFWYRADAPGGAREFLVVDATKGTRLPAFDHAKLAAALSKTLDAPQQADHLPVDRIALRDGGKVAVQAGSKAFIFDEAAGTLEPAESLPPLPQVPPRGPGGNAGGRRRPGSRRGGTSPDGKWSVKHEGHNLILRATDTGAETPLTKEGTEADGYEPEVIWSPDSTHLVGIRVAKGDDRKVYLIESSPKDGLQPKLSSYDYLKPGDRVPIRKPHLFRVETKAEVPIKDDLFANPYSLDRVRWLGDGSAFTFHYNQRGHQVLRVVSVDARIGEAKTIVEDVSPTFVDYSSKGFAQEVEGKDELIWMSERSGWNHLYLVDTKAGAVKNPITTGEWVVRQVDRVDEEGRQIWFRVLGIRPGQDPYHVHFARVNFDGTGLTLLTEGDGSHDLAFSPDRRYYVDTYSRVDMPPVSELRRSADGSLVVPLERGDWALLLAAGWRIPERFVAKGRDGSTDIHGVIFRPTNFDPAKKYPVIEQIYAGPQGAFVPKEFAPYHRPQELAELGFVVVQIDGMGTNWRSKAFHDVCWKNLGDAGLPDRILWMKAAAAKDPALDVERVGVYGGSAGGQNAMGAVLFHPEFYKAAAADCGCHDNRMDKIWWNEAWMGWPVGPHYAEQSNVVNAHKLRGKLLLFVGELDRNVDPASTMQVVDALIKADKDFEFVVIPGGGHGSGSGKYGTRRMRDFFVRSFLGVEPRS